MTRSHVFPFLFNQPQITKLQNFQSHVKKIKHCTILELKVIDLTIATIWIKLHHNPTKNKRKIFRTSQKNRRWIQSWACSNVFASRDRHRGYSKTCLGFCDMEKKYENIKPSVWKLIFHKTYSDGATKNSVFPFKHGHNVATVVVIAQLWDESWNNVYPGSK